MILNRREFAGALGLGALAGTAGVSGFLVGGCNPASVWKDIETWLPAGISSFEAIVTLVAPIAAPGIDAAAELVKSAFAVLSGAVDQYINAPAADKGSWLGKVETAFKAVEDNMQAFLTAIGQTGNPIVKLALALANIILSTISSFLAQIGPTPAPVTLRAGAQTVNVVPVSRNRKSFVAAFNTECVQAGHPELEIH
jgi:hypothetical protein